MSAILSDHSVKLGDVITNVVPGLDTGEWDPLLSLIENYSKMAKNSQCSKIMSTIMFAHLNCFNIHC